MKIVLILIALGWIFLTLKYSHTRSAYPSRGYFIGVMPGGYLGFAFLLVGFPIANAYWFVMKHTLCKAFGHSFIYDSQNGCDMCKRCRIQQGY